jgi:predicted phage-related endonuclease
MTVEVITPRDRAAWMRARGQDVTASTVGALFNAHEYMTQYELWALKTGRLPTSVEDSPAMRRGRLLEPVAVQLIRQDMPHWTVTYNAGANTYYRDPDARLGATPDVIVDTPERGRGVVQIKSVEQSAYRRKWLDADGEPEVPLWIALQATLEAHLVGAQFAMVAPLVIGHGIDMPLIEVPLVPGVIDAIRDRTAAFWQMIAEDREPVPDYARDARLLDRLYPWHDDGEEVDLTGDNRIPELLAARQEATEAKRAAEARIAAVDAEVKSKMGVATVAHIAGGWKIEWRTRRRAATTTPPSVCRALTYPRTP